MAGDLDTTLLPCVTSLTSTHYLPPTSFHRHRALGRGCSLRHLPRPSRDESDSFPSQAVSRRRDSALGKQGDSERRQARGGREGGVAAAAAAGGTGQG